MPSDDGKVTPALFDRFKARIAELAADPNTFWTDQFSNGDALDGYSGIGRELLEQVGHVDAFVGAVGTAGMLVGVSSAFKSAGASTRIVALGPSTSPFLTTGKGGPHRVEGTAAGFRPPHLREGSYDEVRAIDENEARATARRAAREEGTSPGRHRDSIWPAPCNWPASSARGKSSRPSRWTPDSSVSPATCTNP